MIEINQSEVRQHLEGVVRETVEETLNTLLDAETDRLCGAIGAQRRPAGHEGGEL